MSMEWHCNHHDGTMHWLKDDKNNDLCSIYIGVEVINDVPKVYFEISSDFFEKTRLQVTTVEEAKKAAVTRVRRALALMVDHLGRLNPPGH